MAWGIGRFQFSESAGVTLAAQALAEEHRQQLELLTLKNRLLSPTVNLFVECARGVAKSIG